MLMVDEQIARLRDYQDSYKNGVAALRSYKPLPELQMFKLLGRVCKEVKSAYSTWIQRQLAVGDYTSILRSEVNPLDYDDPSLYFQDRQLMALLKKFPFSRVTTAAERKSAAMTSVEENERVCQLTNERLRRGLISPMAQCAIMHARRKIRRWLGKLDVSACVREGDFGPGLTQGLDDSARVAFYHKISGRATATPALLPFLRAFFTEHPGWARSAGMRSGVDDYGTLFYVPDVDICPANRVTSVPKTALVDRPIAIEPSVNQFLQKGTGKVLRNRLRRIGIDLINAQPIHMELARLGSIYPWLISTLDLSNASDTIAIELVFLLLPYDWFQWLNLIRSREGDMPDGRRVIYQKFSSMGNAFTFELETLIFLALAHGVYETLGQKPPEDIVRVYGDDIIVTTDVVPMLTQVLTECGFSINSKKSYTTQHPFRESCGADYFSGVAVRPIYITKELNDVSKVVDLCNRLYKHDDGGPAAVDLHALCRVARLYLLDRIPDLLRRLISTPVGVEGGLWSPEAFWQERLVYNEQLQRSSCPSWRLVNMPKKIGMDGLAAIIHAAERSSESGRVALRGVGQLRLAFEWDPVPVH